jgi:predicted nucleic acid-binding protein
MSKVLVDTNVLVYAKDSSSIFHSDALALFKGVDDLFITSKNLTEYYAVTTRGDKPLLTPSEALLDINEFISSCSLLYPSETSHQELSLLILKYNPKGLLIHDFEIAAIGLANGINNMATFNKRDFQRISELVLLKFY